MENVPSQNLTPDQSTTRGLVRKLKHAVNIMWIPAYSAVF